MACYHPLKGWKIGINPSGKPKYKITGYDVLKVINKNGIWMDAYKNIPSDIFFEQVNDFVEIPCGHCIGCQLERSRQWADRCMLEAKYHTMNCFITLTFDEYHIKEQLEEVILVNEDGELKSYFSLDKSVLQKFLKRLRKRLDNEYGLKVRYFACGEYGTHTARPHFHVILFGYDFSDNRVLFKHNFRGDSLFVSPLLDDVWPFGNHLIADCTWDTCAYVARYCIKKSVSDDSLDLASIGLEPEFNTMSRRPGIARSYYDDHSGDIYRYQVIDIGDKDGAHHIRPPRYYDKLYDLDNPEDMQRIKSERMENAILSKCDILMRTDKNYLDYLKVKEDNLIAKTKILKERSVGL